MQTSCIDLNDGQIGDAVAANQLRLIACAVRQNHFQGRGTLHHVGVGDDIAIACRNDAGTLAHRRDFIARVTALRPSTEEEHRIIVASLIILDAYHRRDDLLCHLLGSQFTGYCAGRLIVIHQFVDGKRRFCGVPRVIDGDITIVNQGDKAADGADGNHQARHHAGYNLQGCLFAFGHRLLFFFRLLRLLGCLCVWVLIAVVIVALPHYLALVLAVIALSIGAAGIPTVRRVGWIPLRLVVCVVRLLAIGIGLIMGIAVCRIGVSGRIRRRLCLFGMCFIGSLFLWNGICSFSRTILCRFIGFLAGSLCIFKICLFYGSSVRLRMHFLRVVVFFVQSIVHFVRIIHKIISFPRNPLYQWMVVCFIPWVPSVPLGVILLCQCNVTAV